MRDSIVESHKPATEHSGKGVQMIGGGGLSEMTAKEIAVALSIACAFFTGNLCSYYLMPQYSMIDDGFVYFGWPFDIYAEGGFAGTRVIIWTGVIGNVVLALCAARIAIGILRLLSRSKTHE
jgi:hypothetical protein